MPKSGNWSCFPSIFSLFFLFYSLIFGFILFNYPIGYSRIEFALFIWSTGGNKTENPVMGYCAWEQNRRDDMVQWFRRWEGSSDNHVYYSTREQCRSRHENGWGSDHNMPIMWPWHRIPRSGIVFYIKNIGLYISFSLCLSFHISLSFHIYICFVYFMTIYIIVVLTFVMDN